MRPVAYNSFAEGSFSDIQRHVAEIRRIYDWPGFDYHEPRQFNRWTWHNLPLLRAVHYDPVFAAQVSDRVGEEVRPSYCFLAMYGPDGVVEPHTDRPMCRWTVDLMVSTNARKSPWPLYVEYRGGDGELQVHTAQLAPSEAIVYSGTQNRHYRKPMDIDSDATYANLAFFHFVPIAWQGPVD